MGVKPTQQVLDAERLTADVLDVAFVVLVDSLADKVYQLRRLTAKFLQIDVESIVGAVYLTAIVNKVLHLDIQEQRLIRVLHIEGVETATLGNHRHIGFIAEVLDCSLHTNHILRAIGLASNKVRRAKIHIAYCGREDDVGSLVVCHLQAIRRYHTVKGQLLCQPVIDVTILLLRIDVRSECNIAGYCVSYCG